MDSLHFPKDFDQTMVALTPLDAYADQQTPRGGLRISYKQAAALAAELDTLLPSIRDVCHNVGSNNFKYVKLIYQPPAMYFAQNMNIAIPGDQFFSIDTTNVDAWKSWFPSDGMFVSKLCETNFQPLYAELARGASDISANIIESYPDLAEKAVAMRVDSIKTRSELFGTSKAQ